MIKKIVIDNMKNIVENCMGDSDAYCVATCPMHTDAKGYIKLIREDKGEEAIKLIRDKLFIPGTLGRVCAHPCESECKCNDIKAPMAIASLKRYAADNFDREENWDLSILDSMGKKIAVIGAGPSGLQAAMDLRKNGCNVTVFDKLPVRGGVMAVGIPEYRLPRTVLQKEITYLDRLGIEFRMCCEVGKDIEFQEIMHEYDVVIVAVGKQLGRVDKSLDNHDAKGVFNAADYLKEAALRRDVEGVGKRVMVVGGGDVAMDCCRVSKRLKGVEDVHSICLEDSFQNMASSNHEIIGAIEEGVIFNHAWAIKHILTDKDNRVNKVELKKCLRMFDDEGKFCPIFDENCTKSIDVDTIVFAIGQGVDGSFTNNLLRQRPNSTFECDKFTMQSSNMGKIFIAGDASGESSVIIQAMALGRRAAESAMRYLKGKSLIEGRDLNDTWTYKTKLETTATWDENNIRRQDMGELNPETRIEGFEEVALGYTREEALREADRCKQCQCKLCMKECIMLNSYTDCPKTLFKEYLENGYENMDKMIAFSCNDCSQCTIRCPKDLNLRDNFMAIKEQYIVDNNGENVIEVLKPFDKSQEMECSKEYSTTVLAKDNKKTKYLFVPGCTVPAYGPELIERTLEHLREKLDGEVGAMLQCCGKVTKLIGEDDKFKERNKKAVDEINATNADVIITICPSCYNVYNQTTDKQVISYWDLMRDKIGIPESQKGIGRNSDVIFNIHDSCVTRTVKSHHENVRWILDELGYKFEEMNCNRENTRCCGVGGMVCSSNPELYKKLYTRRAGDCTQDHVITYCGSCRGTMELAGKDALHILNLLFGDTYMKKDAKVRGYKNEEEMWKNRLESKERLNNKK